MCGIAGFQGSFSPALLTRMQQMLDHRGPDHQAHVYDESGQTGLVHTRLSIIDLSPASNQPLWDASGRYCIVFNGEIYNYRELRAELIAAGAIFRSQGDAEVILQSYLRHGRDALRRLNGIFAFAIWDSAERELFLCRDQFGVKPLYYAAISQGVVFGSEIKALLCASEIDRRVDSVALWQYLTLLWSAAPHTPLAAVRKLEPGHYLLVREARIVENAAFDSYPAFEPALEMPLEDAAMALREHLRTAVERQLVADVPVGAFLSGGVDSSALAYFAAQALDRKLQCFTVDVRGAEQEGMAEDLPFAKLVAKQLGVPLEIAQIDSNVVVDLPRMLFALDEPQADPAPINALYIAERARDLGIKVLLSGAAGDDLFAGYRRHYALLQEPMWSWLPATGRHALTHISAALPQRSAYARRMSKAFAYAGLDDRSRIKSYLYWINPRLSDGLLSAELRQDIAQRHIDCEFDIQLDSGVAGSHPLNQMLLLEQRFFLADHNLNYSDKTAMAAGVETRVPFLDPDLVAFANRLPVDWKYRRRDSKWMLKRALTGLLPDTVLHRRKVGFGAPLRAWLRGPLQPWVAEMLSPASINRRGFFDANAVQQLVRADREGKVDAAYTIFSLICIELWARQFIDPALPTLLV